MKVTVTEGLTLAKYAAIGLVAYLAYRQVQKGTHAVTGFYQTVSDIGGQIWEVASEVGHVVTSPVETINDTFGIEPRVYPDGSTKWEKTVPWTSSSPVSNNDAGINWNYF